MEQKKSVGKKSFSDAGTGGGDPRNLTRKYPNLYEWLVGTSVKSMIVQFVWTGDLEAKHTNYIKTELL